MRMYSDTERSSAFARRDSASNSGGVTRSLISSVHFSCMSNPQKEAGAAVVGLRRREARGIPLVANHGTAAREGEAGRRGIQAAFCSASVPNTSGRSSLKYIKRASGMPSRRHLETAWDEILHISATFALPPSASMIEESEWSMW